VEDTPFFTLFSNLHRRFYTTYSFRLGHHHQDKSNKPWYRRHNKPFIPNNPAEAKRLINQILQKAGLPPLEFSYKLLNNSKGGAP